MKKIIFFLILGVISFNVGSFSFAQISMSEENVSLDIKPGVQVNGSILVTNKSTEDIIVKAYFEDLEFVAPYNGKFITLPLKSSKYSCGEWISVNPSGFVLSASGTQRVNYSIKPPLGVKGGYTGVLFFEKVPDRREMSAGWDISLVVRFGCSFNLETVDKIKKGVIEDIISEKNVIKGSLKNFGNVFLLAEGAYYFMDESGTPLERGKMGKFYLPPGEKAVFTIPGASQCPAGKYTLLVNFDRKGTTPLVKEIELNKRSDGTLTIITVKD